jgi:hypothetical protein
LGRAGISVGKALLKLKVFPEELIVGCEPMRAAVLLDLDGVDFIEPSFEGLTDSNYTNMLLSLPATQAKLLISEDEWPLALALGDGRSWKAGSFLLRKPTEAIIERAEELEAEILQEERVEWEAAVREHYSIRIAKEVQPAIEDFTPKRAVLIEELLHQVWGEVEGETCIDACCGSGAGTVALRHAGIIPLSFDNDPALLSLGLRFGRLTPEDTICLDGTKASNYLPHTQLGMVLMAGEITPHNQIFWRRIIEEALELTEKTLVSTGTEKEARLVESWSRHKGRRVAVIENKRDAFYDNWVCDIRRS